MTTMQMMGVGPLDRHQTGTRDREAPTEAERAKQAQERWLAEIAYDAELNYRGFLRREYPHNEPMRRLIVVELGPRAGYWSALNAALPYRWEEADSRHPEGRVCLEGTVEGDSTCLAWPTRRVREGLHEGWLFYCRGYSGDAASWAANRWAETNRPNITVEQAGQQLTASLERQFIAQARENLLAEARHREAQRRGSWLNVSVAWNAELEVQLQQRLQEYRRHPGHLW